MSTPLTAQIIQVTQDSYLDGTGKPVYVMSVKFKVGDHGPFTVPIPIQPIVDNINSLLK